MVCQNLQPIAGELWRLVRRQHGVLTRAQLLAHGIKRQSIAHRVKFGRLHPVHAGVYAVGRRDLSRLGEVTAAVLACGEEAVASHGTAAELWGFGPRSRLEVTVPPGRCPRRPGIVVHRAALADRHRTVRHGIPVTTPARTLVDLAPDRSVEHLERAVNEADRLDLTTPTSCARASPSCRAYTA